MINITNNNRYLIIDGKTIATNPPAYYVYDNTNIGLNILYPSHPSVLLERYYVLYINKVSASVYDYMDVFFPNSDGSLNINLISILNVLGVKPGTSFNLDIIGYTEWEDSPSFTFSLSINLLSGINRESYIYPVCREAVQNMGNDVGEEIFPPNVIYIGQGTFNNSTRFTPVIAETTVPYWEGKHGNSWTNLVQYSGDSYIFNPFNQYYSATQVTNKTGTYAINQKLICGEYVVIRWKSIFGNTRQHVFLVDSINDDITKTETSIIGNGLTDIKQKKSSIVVSVRGLTRYGLWYYSDLINSEDIHITKNLKDSVINNNVSGTFDYLSTTFTKCMVKESTYAINENNNQFYDLSLTIEYINYGFN